MRSVFLFTVLSLLWKTVPAQHTIRIDFYKYTNGWGSKIKLDHRESEELYNAAGQLIEKRIFANNKTEYLYNEAGQKIAEVDSYSGTELQKRNYTYNDKGWLATMSYTNSSKKYDSVDRVEYYFYNDTGRLEKITRTAGGLFSNQTVRYQYEYKGDEKIVTEST